VRTLRSQRIGSDHLAESAVRGSNIEFSRRQRSATDLLTHYFEVNFDDVAEDLAATGPEPETRDTEATVRLRQAAAAQLREFIRGLIRLRSENNGVDAAQALVQEQAGLSSMQRELLEERVSGILNRVEHSPSRPAPGRGSAPIRPKVAIASPASVDLPQAPQRARGLTPRRGVNRTAENTVLYALVGKALERLDADLCQVYINDSDTMTLRAEAPGGGVVPPGPTRLSRQTGLAAQVGSLGRAVALDDMSRMSGTESTWAARGMQRMAAVGVGAAGEAGSGLLVAARESTRPFTDSDLDTMDLLAIQVASALESADLLARAEELAVLKERMKLAREIHDGLANDLSAVVALFNYHDHRRKTDPADAERLLEQMRSLTEGALQSARDILATLRPRQQPPVNLVDAVRHQVDDFGSTYGLATTAKIQGDGADLAVEESDAIYQILRESLTNVRKHSEATTVKVRLDLSQRPYTLQVEDNGVGIELNSLDDKPGSFGLVGMRERAELLGGWVEIGNSAMGGARVTFRGSKTPLGSL
jgi:signal transduction histidine kinase